MNAVLKIVTQRIGLGLITLFVVSVIIFVAVLMLPGGFAEAILGQAATPETVAAFNKEIGLDKPAVVRYANWVTGVMHGDFGTSYASRVGYRRDVAEMLAPRAFNTLFLAAMTAIIAVPLSIGLGLLAALYRNTWFDRAINSISLISISFPEFFIAYIAIVLLASPLMWRILPPISNIQDDAGLGERIYRCALPAITMTLVIVAHMMRMTRAAIINVLASPYVEMARLKGAKPWQIILRHALPNAWAPIVTVVALNLAYLIVGVVVVEFVFTYPGMGKLMVDAVTARDVPVVQACALVFAATYIVLNLIADVLGIVTNPRLMHPK
ncbi:MAG: ABC transporter permease [Dongiaceae bacterium]